MRHIHSWVFIASLVIASLGTERSLSQAVSLPSDYAMDFQLALIARPRQMGSSSEITGTPDNVLGDQVFNTLHNSLNLPFPWKLTLVNDSVVNAGSTGGGQVYMHRGLMSLIGQNQGLWAAVLSHETAHTALRHQVRVYLEQLYDARMIQYYRSRIAAGDKSANWGLIGFQIAAPIALRKIERDQEHQADQQGMLLMAKSGYHPDYVFALHHLLQMRMGDQSRVGTFFFSDHPRWETRDQRSDKVYADALAEFNRLWPHAEASPGGAPPFVVFMGKPSAKENKTVGTADVTIPLHCRNSNGPVNVILLFEKDHHPIKAADSQLANKDGNLAYLQRADCPDDGDTLVDLHVPAAAVADQDRSAKAVAYVARDMEPLAQSAAFDVHFPKPKKK